MAVQLLTPEQVAERLQIKPQTVRDYLRDGTIRGGFQVAGKWRIAESAIDEFVKELAENGARSNNVRFRRKNKVAGVDAGV